MNLTNLAEGKGANRVIFLLDSTHAQKQLYHRVFKVVDAERMPSHEVQQVIRRDLIAKALDLVFYQIEL